MLSQREHAHLIDQLEHIPRSLSTKERQKFQREINKKLKEHKYASKFSPFESSYLDLIFINRTTSTDTLNRLIDRVTDSSQFILDTESVNIPYQPNIPCLIQLQILQSEESSIILIFEFGHFPRRDQHQFQLIQKLFDILLKPTKVIFIWGDLDELTGFTRYGLFTSAQLGLPQQLNVQRRFRTYWSDMYPHQIPSPDDTSDCSCLDCFGITHDNLISLQDAVAISLHRWIDKRLTRNPFDIGLDPQLQQLNQRELEYRTSMTAYAANDCDAVKQIIMHTNIIHEIQLPIAYAAFIIQESSPSDSPSKEIPHELIDISTEQTSSQPVIYESTIELELQPVPDENDELLVYSNPTPNRIVTLNGPPEQQEETILTPEERRVVHNRSCTLRQRRRLYQYKITCRDIDSRFPIRTIKQMLEDNHIHYKAVNTVKSHLKNKATLYIGVEDPKMTRYTRFIQTLFNTENYNRRYHHNYNYLQNRRYR